MTALQTESTSSQRGLPTTSRLLALVQVLAQALLSLLARAQVH